MHCSEGLTIAERWQLIGSTGMLAQDVAPRVIMEVRGHSHISITMNTYSHISEAQSRDAANRMGEARTSRWTSLLARHARHAPRRGLGTPRRGKQERCLRPVEHLAGCGQDRWAGAYRGVVGQPVGRCHDLRHLDHDVPRVS